MNSSMLEDRRVWLGGGVLVALLLVVASWMMLISPKLDSADSLQAQKDDAETSNQILVTNNLKLAKQARDMTTLQKKLQTALAGLPGDSGFAAFTREVTSLAAQNRVTLTTITISAPTAQTPAAPAVPSEDSSSASSAPATVAPQANSASSVSTIAITLATAGNGKSQTKFLKALQDGPRRVLITSSQQSVSGSSRINSTDAATTMTTQLTIFTNPMSADQLRTIQQDLAAK